jgi:hypothetical protein
MRRRLRGISTKGANMGSLMDNQSNTGKIQSWRQALDQGLLTVEQLALLDQMVTEGQAEDRQAAASMLDWQDTIINKPEHLYGF